LKNIPKLSALRRIENEYLQFFADAEEHEHFVRFTDSKLPSMYSHNCVVLKETLDGIELHKQIKTLFADAQENDRNLYLVLHPNHTSAINAWEADTFDLSSLLYMTMPLDEYKGDKPNSACTVYETTTPSLLQDALLCDIAASLTEGEEHVDYGFAYQRASRKRLVFELNTPAISQYVAYIDGIPVGKCEVSLHDEIIRPESFLVVEGFQRKGIGTALLKKIAEDGKTRGCKEMFVVTDSDDTAKEMYKKAGFQTIGVEYQLLWMKTATP
jgi:spore maturation protein CgeE